jgi:tetratricopeptide (TPR) repeat protein
MDPAAHLPLLARLAYLPLATVGYLARALWPQGLAVLYPHPLITGDGALSPAEVALAVLLLLVLSTLAFWRFRRGAPAAWIGWLWFLGTLVPVSGIVQVGWQGTADRYAYVPLIGLLLALVWSAADALARIPSARRAQAAAVLATGLACALLALASRTQLGHWRSSEALFTRALAVTGPNPVMHNELGAVFVAETRYAAAREQFVVAVALAPDWSAPYLNLGSLLRAAGQPADALPLLERSVALDPGSVASRIALANVLLDLGRREDAEAQLEGARALDATDPRVWLLHRRFESLPR